MNKLFKISPIKIAGAWIIALTCAFVATVLWTSASTSAQPSANCSASFFIDKTLNNGARWQLCWEHRKFDGIVYRDIYFTPPGGISRRVLAEGSISQVHVPYDDNSARFHDITDDGFGDKNLSDLTSAECPNGTLLLYGAKHAVCQQIQPRGYAFKGLGTQQQGELLSLFSVSMSGDYNYIPVWRFLDDGTIDLQMGATGKLQRFTTDSRFGWPVRADGTRGTAHIHNYYWRLDFDLGETASDDIVEELNYVSSANNNRTQGISRLSTEAARSIDPIGLRSWRIRDGALTNANGSAISYQLEPIDIGNRDVGPSFEPWTTNDFYVTKANDCERYVSHNPQLNGCAGNLAGFVNGESLEGADLILWYGTTFHHIPRDEDEPYMHTHWNGFRLTPQDWMDANPAAKNIATCAVGDVTCDGKTDAADALFMLQYDVKLRTISNQLPLSVNTLYGYSCDISGEGRCDATDALFSLQCSVGLKNLFCPAKSGVLATMQSSNELAVATIRIPEPSFDTHTAAQQSVIVDSATGIGSLSVALRYDANHQVAVACEADPDQHFELATCNVDSTAGIVRFSLVSTLGTAGENVVGNINISLLNDPSALSGLIVSDDAVGADVNGQLLPIRSLLAGEGSKIYLPVVVR